MATVQELRDYLPRLEGWHYLNYAGTGPILSPTANLLKELSLEAVEPLIVRWEKWTNFLEKARDSAARLINAQANEIAFVRSTSDGLSLLANAVRWKKGDRVLFPADEFPSNRIVWKNLASRGVEAQAIAPVPNISFAEQLAGMNLSNVRLVAVSAVSYRDGRVHDIAKIASLCRAHQILVCVDAIQAIGSVPLDVRKLGCDFLSSGGQKWLFGPMGAGFVYIRKERLEELFVSNAGWKSVKYPINLEDETFEFSESARRFEPGTLDIPAIAGLGCSIDRMEQIGWPKIYQAVMDWNKMAQKKLKALGYQLLQEQSHSGIAAIRLKDPLTAEKLKKRCDSRKIIVSQRSDYLRISMHACAVQQDFDVFLEALEG